MKRKINWFGFAAGIITLLVTVISLFVPWWQLTVGDNLMKIDASPVNTNFGLFGNQFTLPLIWAMNLVGILTFTTSGFVMLFYSLVPTKSYSKHLLGFSYKKPLFSIVTFLSALLILIPIGSLLDFSIPIIGSTTLNLPPSLFTGVNISAKVSGTFQFPFVLAIVAAALCITARLYHPRIMSNKQTNGMSILKEEQL